MNQSIGRIRLRQMFNNHPKTRPVHLMLSFGLACLSIFALFPSVAGAVLAGENGRIVLTSGRPPETDATSKLFLLPVPSNATGGGQLIGPITSPGGQYRHATWSPDRTKIAYAMGNPAIGNFDLFVQDIEAGTPRVQVTPTEGFGVGNLSADRPAWSPDGKWIAYEHQPTSGSTDRHIRIQPADDLEFPIPTIDLTAPGGAFEGKPAWSPDSQTVYFHRGDPSTNMNSDIFRKPVAGGTEVRAISDSGISESQPSISPDGNSICYTLTNGGFNNSGEVVVAPLGNPGSGLVVSKPADPPVGDYNCTWSPDGQMIAYVTGIYSSGKLVMVRADNTSPTEILLTDAPGFDGNPDWAPDGRPDCPDLEVVTAVDAPVTFSLECEDTGPTYERTEVSEFAESQPSRGTVTQESAGKPFTYTPQPGFTGDDEFKVNSFDGFGFGTDLATVTIRVLPKDANPDQVRCGGRKATIVGTPGRDRLLGTPGRDVIAGLGGADVIRGLGGNDLICGGAGQDRLFGGKGRDRIFGGPGADRLVGGPGRDRLNGGPGRDNCRPARGRDRLRSCERLR